MSPCRLHWSLLVGALVLSACSGGPPPPDWQINAHDGAERATEAWLSGQQRVADAEWARAQREVARTASPQRLARLALLRCAAQVAALQFDPCEAYEALAGDAAPAEQAYHRYLRGVATAADAAALPAAHRALVGAPAEAVARTLPGMPDPRSRLVAAGVAFARGEANPAVVALAVDTASAQGWSRPLLAWLRVQQQLAQAAGQSAEVARIQRRIDLLR